MEKYILSSLSLGLLIGVGAFSGCQTPQENQEATAANHYQPLLVQKGIRHFPAVTPNGHMAILVHGLFRGSFDLASLGRQLARDGYEVYVYDYPTIRKKVLEHGADFRRFLIAAASEHPELTIDIVTHSMGALLTRTALAHLDPKAPTEWRDAEAAQILCLDCFGRIVMIAPPNQGSDVARYVVQLLPGGDQLVKPLPDLSSEAGALAARLPQIDAIPTGIVVARFDAAVKRDYVEYPAEAVTIINTGHCLATRSQTVRRAVALFLEEGHF